MITRPMLEDHTLPDIPCEILFKEDPNIEDIDSGAFIYTTESFEELEEDFIQIDFDAAVSKADRMDYLLAASCGLLSGTLSVLWGEKFDLAAAHDWGNERADDIVKNIAKSLGYQKDDLEGSIRFLENKYPMAGDALTNEYGGGKQHHLRDFSHHPTPIGLITSIMMQFTGIGLGTDTQGNFAPKKIKKDGFLGKTFEEKVVFGTVNWFFHLISDFDGSNGSVLNGTGKGTGIPGPILSLLKEMSSLPLFRKVNEDNINKPKVFSEYISKLFNGTLIKDENGNRIKFDLRTEMGIGSFLINQAKPVIINECIVRTCFLVKKLIEEVRNKNVLSVQDLYKLDPARFMPVKAKSPALSRMITVSTGAFVALNASGAAVKAALKSKGNKGTFCKEFFLSMNYVGVGRFVFACASDAMYIKEDLKAIYYQWKQQREEKMNNSYQPNYRFLTLNPRQLRLLYSFKALAVEYDIEQTWDEKNKILKKEWLQRWKRLVANSMNLSDDDYFFKEGRAYLELHKCFNSEMKNGWLEIMAMEILIFRGYCPLDINIKDQFKKLKYHNYYLDEVFSTKQNLLTREDIINIDITYRGYVSKLKDNGRKIALTALAATGATIASGGLAMFFAPEIAIFLAGDAVAGLSGAALTSASLAAVGGDSLAAGGLGMAGGTAILTGGGALLGLAGSGSATLAAVFGQTSEQYTLMECAKLLTFSKIVIIDRFHMPMVLNSIINGIDTCAENVRLELDRITQEGDKTSAKRMKSSLSYLKNCVRELEKLKGSVENGYRLETKK